MKRLTAIIYQGDSKRWLVAFNPETGTTSQGRTVEQALANLKEATELFLEEQQLPEWSAAFLTTFEVAHA
ncbi:MAG: type II toxin-antitoxin system HicB family antitoxin [Verrucomicrobia bacterium]|nr:type II toxin-antitoxin system HicB family antitoxin [Verrucomicrobiota bacterium]